MVTMASVRDIIAKTDDEVTLPKDPEVTIYDLSNVTTIREPRHGPNTTTIIVLIDSNIDCDDEPIKIRSRVRLMVILAAIYVSTCHTVSDLIIGILNSLT